MELLNAVACHETSSIDGLSPLKSSLDIISKSIIDDPISVGVLIHDIRWLWSVFVYGHYMVPAA